MQEDRARKARELGTPVPAAAKTTALLDLQAKAPVFNGQPPDMRRYPIHFYHPTFTEFGKYLDPDEIVPPEIRKTVMDIDVASGQLYRPVDTRMKVTHSLVSEHD